MSHVPAPYPTLFRGQLIVTCHRGKDLAPVNLVGEMDPYISIAVALEKLYTRAHENGHRNPVWEQTLVFHVHAESTAIFRIKVKDKNYLADKEIGEFTIELGKVIGKNGRRWYQLLDSEDYCKPVGQVELTTEWIPTGGPSPSPSPSPQPTARAITEGLGRMSVGTVAAASAVSPPSLAVPAPTPINPSNFGVGFHQPDSPVWQPHPGIRPPATPPLPSIAPMGRNSIIVLGGGGGEGGRAEGEGMEGQVEGSAPPAYESKSPSSDHALSLSPPPPSILSVPSSSSSSSSSSSAPVAPSPLPRPALGPVFYIHCTFTNYYVNCRGGIGSVGVPLVYQPVGFRNPNSSFRFDGEHLLHVSTGLYVHPISPSTGSIEATIREGVPLGLAAGRSHSARFHHQGGSLRHVSSGLVLWVGGSGTMTPDASVVLRNVQPSAQTAAALELDPVQPSVAAVLPSAPPSTPAVAAAVIPSPSLPYAPIFYWRHIPSGLYVHPFASYAKPDAHLLLQPGGYNDSRCGLQWEGDYVRHVQSNLYLQPRGGIGSIGTPLVLNIGPNEGCRFGIVGGSVRHKGSGLTIHVEGGVGRAGAALTLHAGEGSHTHFTCDVGPGGR